MNKILERRINDDAASSGRMNNAASENVEDAVKYFKLSSEKAAHEAYLVVMCNNGQSFRSERFHNTHRYNFSISTVQPSFVCLQNFLQVLTLTLDNFDLPLNSLSVTERARLLVVTKTCKLDVATKIEKIKRKDKKTYSVYFHFKDDRELVAVNELEIEFTILDDQGYVLQN